MKALRAANMLSLNHTPLISVTPRPVLNAYRLASSSLNWFESTTLGGVDQINSTRGILELQNWLIAEAGSSCAPALLRPAKAAEAAWNNRVDIALMPCRQWMARR